VVAARRFDNSDKTSPALAARRRVNAAASVLEHLKPGRVAPHLSLVAEFESGSNDAMLEKKIPDRIVAEGYANSFAAYKQVVAL